MIKRHYQAVIFDLDGVLTDTAHFHFLAWKKMAESAGVELNAAFNEKLKGVDRMGSLELILGLSDRSYSQEQKLDLATQKNRHYQQLISTMSPNDLLPGALQALQQVRAAGLLTGLASVSRNAFSVLDSLGIRDCFDTVVDAATIVNSKPDPEIFFRAALQLNVLPSACLGVEDSIAGISAIRSAGMFALGIGQQHILTQADRVIPDLSTFVLQDYLI